MTGGSLSSVIYNKTIVLDEVICESLVRNIANGLDYLHDSGILHRDIKSANVLLNDYMQAKISDFDLAINLSEAGLYINDLAGTPNRLAPELFQSPYIYSTKTDTYAFGILVSELIRRERPYKFHDKSSIKNLFKLVHQGLRDPIPIGTPKVFADIITLCTSWEVSKRPSTKKILEMLSTSKQTHINSLLFEPSLSAQEHGSYSVDINEINKRGLKSYSGKVHLWPITDIKSRRNTIPYPNDSMAQLSKMMVITGPRLSKSIIGTVDCGFWNKTPVVIKRITLSNKVLDNQARINVINVLKDLKHPNLSTIIFAQKATKNLYVILEFMTRGSLADLIYNKSIELDEVTSESLVRDIANGLDYLHDSGFLHRDIKSTNILLNDHMQAKISDFALVIESSQIDRYTHNLSGTPNRLAPELFKSPYIYSTKTDTYAFGILVLELIRREQPYNLYINLGLSDFFKLICQGVRDPIPIETPKVLADIIMDCSLHIPRERASTKKILEMLFTSKQNHINTSPLQTNTIYKQKQSCLSDNHEVSSLMSNHVVTEQSIETHRTHVSFP